MRYILCFKCKHFEGMDVDGIVYCSRNGTTRPMVLCPYFNIQRPGRRRNRRQHD